jgi:hypothetical protein
VEELSGDAKVCAEDGLVGARLAQQDEARGGQRFGDLFQFGGAEAVDVVEDDGRRRGSQVAVDGAQQVMPEAWGKFVRCSVLRYRAASSRARPLATASAVTGSNKSY